MKIIALVLIASILQSGCVVKYKRPMVNGNLPVSNKARIEYAPELRGMVVLPKHYDVTLRDQGKAAATNEMKPLFDDAGRKLTSSEDVSLIRDVREADGRKSFGLKTGEWFISTVSTPFFLVGFVGLAVFTMLQTPVILVEEARTRNGTYVAYTGGVALLEKGDGAGALRVFERALVNNALMGQNSDIYFQMARAHEKSGNQVAARDHYRRFLDHSVRQYPEYFSSGGRTLTNDFSKLDAQFTEAESKVREFDAR